MPDGWLLLETGLYQLHARGSSSLSQSMVIISCRIALYPSALQSFINSMVVFVDQRIGKLMNALAPKDAACAIAATLRRHTQAHDITTAALNIRAGRRRHGKGGACGVGCGGRSRDKDADMVEDDLEEKADDLLEEEDVEVQTDAKEGSSIARERYKSCVVT